MNRTRRLRPACAGSRALRAALPAAVGVLVAGCGLAPHESASAPFPSDGVAGFGEAQPVEVCLGPARVIAPGAAAAAGASVCIPTARKPRSCGADTDCSDIEHCICGRCIVQACEGPGSCSTDEVCRGKRCTRACSDDAACGSGQRCVDGGCARKCSSDSVCLYGEQCDALDNVCATRTCDASMSCGFDATCTPGQTIAEVHEPALVAGTDGIGFVELRDGSGARIYRARLETPQRWVSDPTTAVLGDASTSLGAPAAIAAGKRIDLWAARSDGTGIVHATSTDGGASFTLDPSPVLAPESAWEGGRVGSPAVFDKGGHRYLVYEGGAGSGLGVAQLTDTGATRLSSDPIATPAAIEDPIFWRGVTRVGAPWALVDGDVVRVYFAARGAEGNDALGPDPIPAERNDSIGLFTTTDLRTIERYPTGPVFARVVNLRTYLGEEEPSVRVTSDGAELYFVAADAAGQIAGLARAAR